MLWLPKWMRKDAAAQNCPWCGEGTWNGKWCLTCGATSDIGKPSRRTFLFLGAAAAASAALPTPFEQVVIDATSPKLYGMPALLNDGTYHGPILVGNAELMRMYRQLTRDLEPLMNTHPVQATYLDITRRRW